MKVVQTDGGEMRVEMFAHEAGMIAEACQERARLVFSGEGDEETGLFLETASSLLRVAAVATLLGGDVTGELAEVTKKALAALAD